MPPIEMAPCSASGMVTFCNPGAEAGDVNAEERQAEFQPHRLLDENADAPGGEQRVEHAAVEAPDDDALDHQPEQRRHDEGERNGDQDAGMQPDARHHGRVGADHHQFAVRHVDDAHDAVSDGETERDEQQNRAEAQADEQDVSIMAPPKRPPRSARRPRCLDQIRSS